MRRFLPLIILIFLLSLFQLVWRDSLSVPSYSLYTDRKAQRVGDILTVLISEESSASRTAKTYTQKKDEVATSGGGTGILDFIPLFSGGVDYKNLHDGTGRTSRQGKLWATITTKVVEVLPNGDLRIEGKKTVLVNQDKEEITLKGLVRPEDIGPDNTVLSIYVADAQIEYKGKGAVDAGQKKGIILRILDWFF
jgi:flagellar L-ring protein precursor FlgH